MTPEALLRYSVMSHFQMWLIPAFYLTDLYLTPAQGTSMTRSPPFLFLGFVIGSMTTLAVPHLQRARDPFWQEKTLNEVVTIHVLKSS